MKMNIFWLTLMTAALSFVILTMVESQVSLAQDRPTSQPGDYRGYSPVLYDGYKIFSQYVTVRDGTRLAVDVIRPTR